METIAIDDDINGGDAIEEAPGGSRNSQQQQHDDHQRATQEKIIKQFWLTYDEIIILSICSIFGIAFRLLGASWFRLELNFIFSEDSALGTNLPLNILSCFLMGVLCSGKDAMSIVTAKVLGGGIAGRGIVDVGRRVIDRSRGELSNIRRRRNRQTDTNNIDSDDVGGTHHRSTTHEIEMHDVANSEHANAASMDNSNEDQTVAGLLGLDEEFRIGVNHSSEDELRSVQLNALTRRIMMSPSLVLFPAKKDNSVFSETRGNNNLASPDISSNDQFEIGDEPTSTDEIDNEMEHTHDKTNSDQAPSGESSRESEDRIVGNPRLQSQGSEDLVETSPSSGSIMEGVNERLNSIADNVTAIRHADFASGWKVGTSPDDMKHIILIGLRMGFCGAISTFSSWNAAMVNLVKNRKIGEAIGGYAIGLQLGKIYPLRV